MRRNNLSINYSTKCRKSQYMLMLTLVFASVFLVFNAQKAAAKDVQNFYFESFVADYYLGKDDEGVSKLKVVETFTAVFPNYNQNKGLCRRIPYTSNNGKNRTIESLDRDNIKVSRNGHTEPIYSIQKTEEGEEFEVCTGTEEYVTGTQVYTFEYEFKNVVTDFTKNGNIITNTSSKTSYTNTDSSLSAWQELYWDTNGIGFSQKFKSLTARVHLEEPVNWTGNTWCYVGRYGSSNQSRCTTTRINDGVMFETGLLGSNENLTFDIELKPGSFKLPSPKENHAMPVVAGIVVAIIGLVLTFSIRAFYKASDNRKFYKSLIAKPEYEPPKGIDMHTLAEDFIGTHSNPSVATIVKLVTDGRIELIKGEKKLLGGYNWEITIKDLNKIGRNEELILQILNGGSRVYEGETIKLERHYGNSHLASLGQQLDKYGRTHGHSLGLLVDDKLHAKSVAIGIIMFTLCILAIPFVLEVFISDEKNIEKVANTIAEDGDIAAIIDQPFYADGYLYVNMKESIIAMVVALFVGTILNTILRSKSEKYLRRTTKGLEVSRQLEGLKLYIKMAEAERIAFLQSVPGADTSPEGIVKLYEKLLPYAIFFGLEKTWLKEMNNYCELNHLDSTSIDLNVSDVVMMSSFIRTIPQSTNFSSGSSSGGSSSSYSGGGGGGFSGGGGGGGGGGGR